MLDSEIKSQLKTVFESLDRSIDLVFEPSTHSNQNELVEMLEEVASTCPRITARLNPASQGPSEVPRFHIEIDRKPSGIFFTGIPGGHEFSSLVIAILNASQKGKQPDPGFSARIQSLKGPIRLKTYISLTCENCPDVVQTLNQMALIHADFRHEMIDGAYAQSEIEALGIQGVPSVIFGTKLIHSGKINPLDLLKKLETEFGTESSGAKNQNKDLGHFDVVVIGGGPAGISAAIYSARKGLKTALLAETLGGQLQETKGIENMISQVYTEGPELSAQLVKHLKSYPVTLLEQRRVQSIDKTTRKIEIEGGEFAQAESIIVATGAKWRELGIPGEKEYLGRGVAFCPHCDGPFYKGKKVAVIGGGNSGVEAAIDLAGIVSEVVLVEYNSELKADKVLVDKLKSLANTSIVTHAKTQKIIGDDKKVRSLEYLDRSTETPKSIELDGIFVQIGLLPNSQFLKGVVELTPFGEIKTDEKGRTNIPGIYAAGDVTTIPFKQIIISMGEGAKVALASFEDRMRKSG